MSKDPQFAHYGRSPLFEQADVDQNRYAENVVVFDIETIQTPNAAEMFSYEQPGNIKKEETVAADRAKKKAIFLARAALHANTARVCAIGYKGKGIHGTQISLAKTMSEEKVLLEEFFHIMKRVDKCAGYNILGFDLPFLYFRARLLRVDGRLLMPQKEFCNQYKGKAVDIMDDLTGESYKSKGLIAGDVKLPTMAKLFGVRSELRDMECSGKDFGEFLVSGDNDKETAALNHLKADVEESWDLYKSI
jgi:predicted PolB exonuclease-like 3'-5' exonuclease